ncbi:hypothetical protein E2C01_070194 [Portunus trituberculatus]|uniref:Uncharacterized protein n=1 Tax=Portunus trituberculatus TaxID=210409 RepID=A0A5B7I4G3_PORTR|nr:hypothetical protein [Portunus trituberculatus]
MVEREEAARKDGWREGKIAEAVVTCYAKHPELRRMEHESLFPIDSPRYVVVVVVVVVNGGGSGSSTKCSIKIATNGVANQVIAMGPGQQVVRGLSYHDHLHHRYSHHHHYHYYYDHQDHYYYSL